MEQINRDMVENKLRGSTLGPDNKGGEAFKLKPKDYPQLSFTS